MALDGKVFAPRIPLDSSNFLYDRLGFWTRILHKRRKWSWILYFFHLPLVRAHTGEKTNRMRQLSSSLLFQELLDFKAFMELEEAARTSRPYINLR
ncbi:unnamed protein product [Blepharisma stoltei]|uniref:Maturase K n=1 Tax=Blepharisma stoltei TaxID=1481888 RepID=A0AAU9J6C0_9CILI|nr:unnamed protein product [Blepharisma stoltei]